GGPRTRSVAGAIFTFYGSHCFEKVHPLQAGVFRRKVRRTRRPALPVENAVLFYAQRLWECLSTYTQAGRYYLWLNRLRQRIEKNPNAAAYTDAALTETPPSG